MRRNRQRTPQRSGRKRGRKGGRKRIAQLHRLGVQGHKGIRAFIANGEAIRDAGVNSG